MFKVHTDDDADDTVAKQATSMSGIMALRGGRSRYSLESERYLEKVSQTNFTATYRSTTMLDATGVAYTLSELQEAMTGWLYVNGGQTWINYPEVLRTVNETFAANPKLKAWNYGDHFDGVHLDIHAIKHRLLEAGYRVNDLRITKVTTKPKKVVGPKATELRSARTQATKIILDQLNAKTGLALKGRFSKNVQQDMLVSIAKAAGVDFLGLALPYSEYGGSVNQCHNKHKLAAFEITEGQPIPVMLALQGITYCYIDDVTQEHLDYLTSNLTAWWDGIEAISPTSTKEQA